MVSSGLSKLGFQYINLDDCWAKGRYANGTVYPDAVAFPSGMKALADYVHSKGLKFGVYTDRGTLTCGGRPGSLDHEKIDADTYASWGVDYVKEDSCYASGDHQTAFDEYGRMRDGLNATGRPIYFSLCGWSDWYAPVGWSLGNSWRIGPDDTNWPGILTNIDIDANLAAYSRPGGWNDPCLLLGKTFTGSLRVTEQQSRTQFNMWAIIASPLLISANIREMSAFTLETYSNTEVIAVDQDPLGKQGKRLVGGPLSPQISGAHLTVCDGSKAQQWTWNDPMVNFVHNKDAEFCLNIDNCGTGVIYYPCVTTGGTCAGPNSYANEQFEINAQNQLISLLNNKCVTVQPTGSISLDNCVPNNAGQKWSYQANTLALIQDGRCLTVGAPTKDNVWARPLFDGSWAVVFLNVGASSSNTTCDASCFQQMGFTPSTQLVVRDLWQHKNIGTTTASTYTVYNIPPQGGSVMLKFTKQ